MKILTGLLFLTFSFLQLNAQEKPLAKSIAKENPESLSLVKTIYLKDNGEQIKGIYYLQQTEEFVRFYSTPLDTVVTKKGKFQGIKSGRNRCGIIFQDGLNIHLDDNKVEILSLADGQLICLNRNIEENTSEIKKFKIINHQLVFEKQLSFPSSELNIYSTKDIIIVSDEFEGMGNYVDIYDPDLILLHHFRPFGKTSFGYTTIGKNDDQYLIFSQNFLNTKLNKLIFFNKKHNSEDSLFLNSNLHYVQSVKPDGNLFYIIGDLDDGTKNNKNLTPVFQCYDFKGHLIWSKNLIFPLDYLERDVLFCNDELVCFNSNKLGVCEINFIDKNDGNINHKIMIDSIYQFKHLTNLSGNPSVHNYLFDYQCFHTDQVELVIGNLTDSIKNDKRKITAMDLVLMLINKNTKKILQVKLPYESIDFQKVKVAQKGNLIEISNNKKILYYEIH